MMRNYKVGLSLIGIVAVVLAMLPNTIYLFYSPPNDALSDNEANYWLWNVLENIGRFGLIITLCIVINKTSHAQNRILMIASMASLVAYYLLWIVYFIGKFNGFALVGMALFSLIFFLFTAWRKKNIFVFAFALLFAIMHIAITSSNFTLNNLCIISLICFVGLMRNRQKRRTKDL